jgi:hypothetical protein
MTTIESTTSNLKTEKLTIGDLKKAALSIQKMKEKPLPKGLGWFTKLMGRFGWHREYEVIVFDSSKFGIINHLKNN